MSAKRIELGPVGWRVVENVTRLRTEQRLTYAELSARLAQAGRPIPALGLSRVERGERRVDADDLVALAEVLGVTASDLLGPSAERPSLASILSAVADLDERVHALEAT